MTNMKKDFQKVVKMFRDKLPDKHYKDSRTNEDRTCRPEYPKAMLTSAQERKKTATVNFGKGETSRMAAGLFQAYEPFITWCESYGITKSEIELNSDNCFQVRVSY